jgi:hypothetical protein
VTAVYTVMGVTGRVGVHGRKRKGRFMDVPVGCSQLGSCIVSPQIRESSVGRNPLHGVGTSSSSKSVSGVWLAWRTESKGKRDHHNETIGALDNRLVADDITEGLISVNVVDFVLDGDRTKSPR